jgi:hypothetical protein
MAVAHVLARLRREPLEDCALADRVNQLCAQQSHCWRNRMLTPLVMVRLMLLQVLHGNTAITHLRQLSGLCFAPSSFCEARERLPLRIWQELLQWAAQLAQASAKQMFIGTRVLIADCSSFSMSDTPALRQHFGQVRAGGVKAGVGYPVAKLAGLLDAATGMFLQMLAAPLYTHDLRHLLQAHPLLRPGDILLGDRAYCSFAHLALLQMRGVFGCFRLHQRRKFDRSGRQRWKRSGKAPMWLSAEQWLTLPKWLDVRIVCYSLAERGFRTQHVIIATTLLDEQLWSAAKVAELYGHRWRIETCFNHLKTHLKMNVLKCQSVDGVMKELATYLLVFNLVRLAMLRLAECQKQSLWRLSFIDACRWMSVRLLGLEGVQTLIINPLRSGRHQPRVIRRRMKEYDLMTKPRASYKTTVNSTENG